MAPGQDSGTGSGSGLRVIQVAASLAPSDGGSATGIVEINRALRERGVQATIVATDSAGHGHLPRQVCAQLTATPDISVELHRMHRPTTFKSSRGLSRAVVRHAASADVVHVHGLYLWHTAAAARSAVRFGVPYVIQPHGSLEAYQRRHHRLRKAGYDWLLGRRILDRASAVVFADASEAEHAQDIVPVGKARIAPLGARLDEIEEGWRPDWWGNALAGRPVVLYLGRLARKKRVDLLIRSWPRVLATFPSAVLLIVGPDEPPVGRELHSLAAALPSDSVRFLGELTGTDKAFAYRAASVFVLPSENENFAVSVAEALLAGTPVVVSSGVATHRLVRDYAAGRILSALTPDAVAEAVIQALEPTTNAAWRRGARTAAPHVTWRATAARLEEVYEELAR